jgi:ATP synthase protein I
MSRALLHDNRCDNLLTVIRLRLSSPSDASRKPGDTTKDGWARAMREAGPYLGLGTSLALTVLLGVGAGHWVDGRLNSEPVFTLVGSFVGLAAALYGFFRTVLGKKT